MRRIALKGGGYATVDDEDFEHLSQWRWSRHPHGYAYRRHPHRYMHREVAARMLGREPRGDELVHHRFERRRDNRRSQLEVLTALAHKARHHRDPGVRYDRGPEKRRKRWLARPTVNGRRVYLGRFLHEHEAKEACDVAAA